MTELHLFTAIFERENKFVDIQYFPYGFDGTLGEYQLTVRGQMGLKSYCILTTMANTKIVLVVLIEKST